MEDWVEELRRGAPEASWEQFIDRYRRLIFSAIRHYVQDYDDVMDVFARVCEALREDDLRRLRSWADQDQHRARFSSWLVTVVRHLTIDWFRNRDGRRRVGKLALGLPPLRQQIFQHVFVARRSHTEAYELIRTADPPGPSFPQFLVELRETYQAVTNGRRGRLLRELAPPLPELELEPIGPVAELDRRAWLGRALETLEPADQVALQLYVIEELPAAEIAKILGLPNAKAVYNRVYRGLDAMRARLEEAGLGRSDL